MEILLPYDRIQQRIAEMGQQIKQHVPVDQTTFVCVLKGARRFYSDLLNSFQPRPFMSDMREAYYSIRSYAGTRSTETITCNLRPSEGELSNPYVVVVDDILDTGLTMEWILDDIRGLNPLAKIRTCVLINKLRPKKHLEHADYEGFTIDNRFVIGFGLDYDNRYRHLDDVMAFEDGESL